jgi:membrane-bound lytic murein transglycosylase B
MTIQVPPHLVPILQQASQQSGVPFNILAAKLAQESRFNPNARGAAGEIGIAQVMPTTAARPGYGLPPITLQALGDPAQAIPWAANYLAARARAAGTFDWNNALGAARGLAAYNGSGPQAAAYGRQVAQMAGMVVPPEPPTGDDGNAPMMRTTENRPASWAMPQESRQTEDQRLTGEVLQMLRMAQMVGGY